MIMQFRQDGPSFTIASLTFGDALAQNSEKLKDRVSDLVGKSFSRFAIELFENEQVRPVYFATGQIRVKFGAPSVHFGGGSDPGAADSLHGRRSDSDHAGARVPPFRHHLDRQLRARCSRAFQTSGGEARRLGQRHATRRGLGTGGTGVPASRLSGREGHTDGRNSTTPRPPSRTT